MIDNQLSNLITTLQQVTVAVNSINKTLSSITYLTTGISATIVTAKLTGGGTNGSMTFVNGVLTAQTPAT
jgi:mevalonate kinase